MPTSPTRVITGIVVATIAVVTIVGCASSGDEAATEEESTSEGGTKPPPKDDDRPAFDASIEPSDGGTDPDADPNPPNPDQCIDQADPGGSENVAKSLGAQEDCDNSVKTVKGVLNGFVDVDYYKLTLADKFGCSVDTDVTSPTTGVELCVFVKCTNGTTTSINGCGGGVQRTSEIGMKGCCAASPSKPTPDWDCGGITDDDSADMFIRVKNTGKACLPYTFTYRF